MKCIKIIRKDGALVLKTAGTQQDADNWTSVFTTDRMTMLGDTIEIHLNK